MGVPCCATIWTGSDANGPGGAKRTFDLQHQAAGAAHRLVATPAGQRARRSRPSCSFTKLGQATGVAWDQADGSVAAIAVPAVALTDFRSGRKPATPFA